MANFEYDSNPDNEWDDSWETIWNEHDWERYLQNEKSDVRKYQKIYNKLVHRQNRLDEVALRMDWELPSDSHESADLEESSSDTLSEEPYTLHKHPLFIASKALHEWMTEKWLQHVSLCSDQISPTQALILQNVINQSDHYGLLAVTALDLGDYTLAIAYFKRGLAALNSILAHLVEVTELDIAPLNSYSKHAKIRIFDLREIWLRVIGDCRAASIKPFDDE
jgi:hypothetical protein